MDNDSDKKFPATERIIEVPPPDYQSLKDKVRLNSERIDKLQQRCHALENILAYCDISSMTQIIKEYKSMSDFYLMQLVKEMEIYRVNEDERSEMLNFPEYRLPVDDIFSRNKVEALIFVLERTIVFYEEYGHADTAVLNSLKAKLNIYQNLLFAINVFLVSDSQDIRAC